MTLWLDCKSCHREQAIAVTLSAGTATDVMPCIGGCEMSADEARRYEEDAEHWWDQGRRETARGRRFLG